MQLVGGPNQPVAFSLRIDDYLASGVDREACDPAVLPPGQQSNGIPACHVKMTANGTTRAFWLRREERADQPLQPNYRMLDFGGEFYQIALDHVRTPLPFSLKLTDFERGLDPGTEQASSFTSEVQLTDTERQVDEKPVTITMNQPMTWRGYTFYQSNYIPIRDPRTGQNSGRYASIFQVRYDPIWVIVYTGCMLVVLGTIVQFWMRSGVFTGLGLKAARTPATAPRPEMTSAEMDVL